MVLSGRADLILPVALQSKDGILDIFHYLLVLNELFMVRRRATTLNMLPYPDSKHGDRTSLESLDRKTDLFIILMKTQQIQ